MALPPKMAFIQQRLLRLVLPRYGAGAEPQGRLADPWCLRFGRSPDACPRARHCAESLRLLETRLSCRGVGRLSTMAPLLLREWWAFLRFRRSLYVLEQRFNIQN